MTPDRLINLRFVSFFSSEVTFSKMTAERRGVGPMRWSEIPAQREVKPPADILRYCPADPDSDKASPDYE